MKSLLRRIIERPVPGVSAVFTIVYCSAVIFMITALKTNDTFFLHGDGYYVIGINFFKGVSGLSHQYLMPLFPFILSLLGFFPENIHPALRIIMTLALTYGNIFVASRIFSSFLSPKQIFTGLLIFVLTPLYLHWSIKLTAEVILTLFLGLIILSFQKFYLTRKPVHLVMLFISILLACLTKPVFFFVPVFFLLFALYRRNIRLSVVMLIVVLYSLVIQLSVMEFARPLTPGSRSYGTADLLAGSYYLKAVSITGQLNTNSHISYARENADRSNLLLANKMLSEWLDDFRKEHPDASLSRIVAASFLDSPGLFVLSKIISPLFFICLSSGFAEMLLNFIINILLIFFAVRSMRKYLTGKKDITLPVIFGLLGFFATYFFTFCIARYSVPFMFYLSVFAGPSLLGLFDRSERLQTGIPQKKIN